MNIGIAIASTLFLGLFYSWTSRLNAIFFFGRSLGPEARSTPEAEAIASQYRTSILGLTLAALALSLFGRLHHVRAGSAGPLVVVLGFSFAFARAHRAAGMLAQPAFGSSSTVQIDLAASPTYRIPGWAAVLLPVELALAALGVVVVFTPHAGGLGNAWVAFNDRVDSHHVAMLLGMGTGLLSSATLLLGLLKTSARLRTPMAQYSIRASVVLQWVGLLLLATLLVISRFGITVSHHVSRGLVFAGVLLTLLSLVWNQQRSRRFVPPAVELGADYRWRWGLFYVDRDDPALFVQSRCGAGYTLNYGRILAWPIALALVAYAICMLFLSPLRT